jgi:hypothetical protein
VSAAGLLEHVALALSGVLHPIATELSPTFARATFARLGLRLSDAQVASLEGPLGTVVTGTITQSASAFALADAIAADDQGAIAREVAATLTGCTLVLSGLADVANRLAAVGAPAVPPSEASVFPERLFNHLLARRFEAIGLNDTFLLLGLLERQEHDQDSTDPERPPWTRETYHFDQITGWCGDPAAQLRRLYGWGPGFDGRKLFALLDSVLSRNNLPVIYDDTANPPVLDLVFLQLLAATGGAPGLTVRLENQLPVGQVVRSLGEDLVLQAKLDFEPPFDTALTIGADRSIVFQPPTPGPPLAGDFSAAVTARRVSPPEPFYVLGKANSSRLTIGELGLRVGTHVEWDGSRASGDLQLELVAADGQLVIDTSEGDGFLAKILPATHLEAGFQISAGVSSSGGFYFGGSSALEVRLPVHVDVGPVSLEGVTVRVGIKDGRIPIDLGVDVKAGLGPIVAVVQNLGVTTTFSFPPGHSGNLGPLQLDVGFKAPSGVGLSLDGGIIRGGGFLSFDPQKGEYAGALELTFAELCSLKAIAIISTRFPDGRDGFSLLILVTAEFVPIQLGFGFTLNGVGGLLGLNRTVDVDALKSGVRTGELSSILFPRDIVANITRIISDLNAVFPIAEGHFVIAPMGKLGWGTPPLITLDIGIVLDIPRPALVILGAIRCLLPSEDAAILALQVNFAGGIDFERGEIWFDASLFDSRLLIYTLCGDMALRISWGDHPLFVVSVGGFHPAFKEVPPDLTGMKRMTIGLLSGDNPRLNVQTYYAITSNSVQSGSRVELYAAACGFSIYGFLGYDLLVQFSPFHFVADLYAGLALRCGEEVIAGISVRCELSGPSPWHAQGEATFEVLFFEITIGFDTTWGEDAPAQVVETEDVRKLLVDAVSDDRNWKVDSPASTHVGVTLRKLEPGASRLLMQPFGVLSVSQKVVPLGLEIDKFGNKKPVGDTRFGMTWSDGAASEVREEFALANFVKLSDSEKLSRQSFEKMPSGLSFSADDRSTSGSRVQKDVSYELSYLHRKRRLSGKTVSLFKGMFTTLVRGAAATRTSLSVSKRTSGNGPAVVEVQTTTYHVVRSEDLAAPAANLVAMTEAEAFQLHDDFVGLNPSLRGTLQVLASHELN